MTSLILVESVNAEAAKKLKNITFQEYIDFCGNINLDDNKQNIGFRKYYKRFKKYINLQINNKFEVSINYSRENNEGRFFCNNDLGLQNLKREYKSALCKGLYLDFDMINAHPVILKNICDKNSIPYDYLNKYCIDREKYIEELKNDLNIERKEAKELYLKSLNYNIERSKWLINGKWTTTKNKFYIEYDKEIKTIQKNLSLKLNDEFKKYTDTKKILTNKEGRFLSYLLQKTEAEILEKVRLESGIELNCLMFDGFMTKDINLNIDETINKLNSITSSYNVKWSNKDFDNKIIEKIQNINNNEVQFYFGENIIDLANQILKNDLKNKIFICDNVLWSNIQNNITWSNNKEHILNKLFVWISDNDMYIETSQSKRQALNNRIKLIKELAETIALKAPINDNLESDIWEKTQYKIVFNNGYYDFKKNDFINNHNDLFTVKKINYDFKNEWNEEANKELLNKVFYPIFGIDDIQEDKIRFELLEYFLQRLARTIAGCIEDKRFFVLCGLRDCGKGVIAELIKKTFKEYITFTDSSNFLYKKQMGDSAKNNSWIIDFIFSRLSITSEISTSDKEYIDGNKIKKFCSGGDYITGRKNFKDEVEFRIQSGLMICCNDLPDIDPLDTMEKCDNIYFNSKFINNKTYSDYKLTNIKYYEADNDIKNCFLARKDIINQFILLLIKYYNKPNLKYPEELKLKEKEEDENNNDIDKIKSIFQQGTDADFVDNKDIKNHLRVNNLNISMKMFKVKINGIYQVENATTFNKRGYKGLKMIED